MAKNNSPDKPDLPASFEDALRELEAIVASMERGDLDLDPSLAAYQRGTDLLKFCQDKLSAAENKIRIFDNGVLHDAKLGNPDLPTSVPDVD